MNVKWYCTPHRGLVEDVPKHYWLYLSSSTPCLGLVKPWALQRSHQIKRISDQKRDDVKLPLLLFSFPIMALQDMTGQYYQDRIAPVTSWGKQPEVTVLSCNKQLCAWVNKPQDQINLNKPPRRSLQFAPTVTYRSQPWPTQASSKHHVQRLKQQTNPKVGNIRELPHRNQPLWGFTPLLVLPKWEKPKLFHRQDPCFSKGLWGWEEHRYNWTKPFIDKCLVKKCVMDYLIWK